MGIKFTNNMKGQLSAGITSSGTTITLKSGEGAECPVITTAGTDYFYLTLVDSSGNREIVCIVDRSTDTLTVGVAGGAGTASVSGRGLEGTTAQAFSADDIVELRLTEQGLSDLYDEAQISASDLIQGGSVEVDGDKIDIDYTPGNYTPSTSPSEVTDANHLSAHLDGIDNELGTLDSSITSGLAAKASIDGDVLDVDFTPSNYTPDASPAEASDVDDLSAHLKGIDTAILAAGAMALFNSIAVYAYKEASGTSSSKASVAGSFTTVPLNTEEVDTDSIGALASNLVTLDSGTYLCFSQVTGYRGSKIVARLRNTTAGTTLITGSPSRATDILNKNYPCFVFGVFTVAAGQALAVQLYVSLANAKGFGVAYTTGEDEVFCRTIFIKLN